jgi:polysaccharide export outer membrane protein
LVLPQSVCSRHNESPLAAITQANQRHDIDEGAMKIYKVLLAALVFAATPILGANAVEADYTLNPGDVLQITVWKEDGLDREVLVVPDGSINFPLAGTLSAAGKTTAQLQDEIVAKLQKYIPDASVAVSVKAALGNVVDVIGQVAKPGELTIGHRTTVMQALSMAGGLTPYASENKIIILRTVDGKESSIAFPYDDVQRGQSLDKDIALSPGDVVVVPSSTLF